MYIPIILGTAREGRFSEKVANLAMEIAKESGIDSEMVDIRDYRLAATDNIGNIPQAKKWAEKVNKADALVMVAPEYNHGYSGELKMFLDMLYEEYFGKPVGLCGVSMGPWGGTRGIQALKLTCLALGMHPILQAVYVPNIRDAFDEKTFGKQAKGMLEGLVKLKVAIK
ncbi:MAG: NAD(P)H-dependent oxidoreductase [Candidatus Margulisbacteria bacterium]|nr:NAD(P)H-dependent oxidoreductase [Candidatus Margulisiibacteriota bacterium]